MTQPLTSAAALLRPLLLSAGLAAGMVLPAAAASGLPAPFVSRALDAVLIPIDGSVQKAFGLSADETGVLVLAVAPGGVADAAGVAPGDVISTAHGHAVKDPISLDEIVYYWIQKGSFDFGFDGWHGGKAQTYTSTITLESYSAVIDVAVVASWSSYSYESFSYAEYTTEYSSEISESYSSSETMIEETTSSAEFATEETATDTTATEDTTATDTTATDATATDATGTDGATAEPTDPNLDTDGDGTPDVSDTDDDNDGIPDATDSDENGDGTADAQE